MTRQFVGRRRVFPAFLLVAFLCGGAWLKGTNLVRAPFASPSTAYVAWGVEWALDSACLIAAACCLFLWFEDSTWSGQRRICWIVAIWAGSAGGLWNAFALLLVLGVSPEVSLRCGFRAVVLLTTLWLLLEWLRRVPGGVNRRWLTVFFPSWLLVNLWIWPQISWPVPFSSSYIRSVADWPLWLMGCQILGTLLVLWRMNAWGAGALAAAACSILLPAVLAFMSVVWPAALAPVVLSGLKIGLLAAWSFAAMAPAAIVAFLLARRRSPAKVRQVAALQVVSRLCLACLVSTASLEFGSRLLMTRGRGASLEFPMAESLQELPDHELLILGVGGSTAQGAPYGNKLSVPSLLGWEVSRQFPARHVRVENWAKGGDDARLIHQKLSALRLRPSLLWIYAGHNEFLQDQRQFTRPPKYRSMLDRLVDWSATYRWSLRILRRNAAFQKDHIRDVGLVGYRLCTQEQYEARLERFRHHLTAVCRFARRQRIPTVLTVPACNLVGLAPNQSSFTPEVSIQDRERFFELFAKAKEAHNERNSEAAVSCLRAALEIDDRFAEAHFLLAETLLAQGRRDEAVRHYYLAVDYDGYPLRASRRIQQIVRDVAAETGAILIEGHDVLAACSSRGLLDDEVFFDLVHPRARGYLALSGAVLNALRTRGVIVPGKQWRELCQPTVTEAFEHFEFTTDDWRTTLRELISYYKWIALFRNDALRRQARAKHYSRLLERCGVPGFKPIAEVEESGRRGEEGRGEGFGRELSRTRRRGECPAPGSGLLASGVIGNLKPEAWSQ